MRYVGLKVNRRQRLAFVPLWIILVEISTRPKAMTQNIHSKCLAIFAFCLLLSANYFKILI
jgi:hypothetical protein